MRIVVLDSLRGLFALSIVFLHGAFQSDFFYSPLVRNSGVFVDFFFVLSGFVITLAYQKRVCDGRSFSGFMIRRVGRLWPLHMFVLAMFLLLALIKYLADLAGLFSANAPYTFPELAGYLVENVFFLHALRNEDVYWLNFPSWSISAEFWAYLTFACVCVLPISRFRWIVPAALLGGAAAVIAQRIDPGFGHFFGDGLYRGIGYFFLGSLTFQAWGKLKAMTLPCPTLWELGLTLLLIWQLYGGSDSVRLLLLPLTFTAMILVFAYEDGRLSDLLKAAPFQALGRWSFSIYLIHAFILSVVGLLARTAERAFHLPLHSANLQDPSASKLLDFGSTCLTDLIQLAIVAIVVACSRWTYLRIELPSQEVFRGLAKRIEGGRQS